MNSIISKNIERLAINVQRYIVEQFDDLSDAPKVSRAEFERRIAICELCPRFLSASRKCSMCGCFMDVKASLKEYPFVLSGEKTVGCADKQQPQW
jgi:hypothetical protein